MNPLSSYKILDMSKLKAFAENKFNFSENIKFVFHRVENIVRKVQKKKPGFQHFLLFYQFFFTKPFPRGCGEEGCQCVIKRLTHTRGQILDSSKLKEFADDNFKIDEND